MNLAHLNWLFGAFFVLAIVFGAFIFWYNKNLFSSYPTLPEYLKKHPEARDKNGVPACFQCNVSNIYILLAANKGLHICRVCGMKLWRS